MFKTAKALLVGVAGLSFTVSTADAGGGGLATGLFFGAVGGQILDQSYRTEQRRKAYEADQMRRERAAAARRAAATQQARAAEYQRIQREKASAANMAAAKADGGSPVKAQDSATGVAPKEDLSSTTVIAKTTPSSSTPPSIQPSSGDEPPASTNTETSPLYAKATTPLPDNSYSDGTTGGGDSDAAGSKLATPVSASNSSDAAEGSTCRKYSAAVGGMVDTPCQ